MNSNNENTKLISESNSIDFDFSNNKAKNIKLNQFLIIKYYSMCQDITNLNNANLQHLKKLTLLENNIILITKHIYALLFFLSFYTFLILCINFNNYNNNLIIKDNIVKFTSGFLHLLKLLGENCLIEKILNNKLCYVSFKNNNVIFETAIKK